LNENSRDRGILSRASVTPIEIRVGAYRHEALKQRLEPENGLISNSVHD
jgi:hypothetical protein